MGKIARQKLPTVNAGKAAPFKKTKKQDRKPKKYIDLRWLGEFIGGFVGPMVILVLVVAIAIWCLR